MNLSNNKNDNFEDEVNCNDDLAAFAEAILQMGLNTVGIEDEINKLEPSFARPAMLGIRWKAGFYHLTRKGLAKVYRRCTTP
jgi:hypothetical protein